MSGGSMNYLTEELESMCYYLIHKLPNGEIEAKGAI